MPSKEIPEHRDKLGRILAVGDTVIYPCYNHLELGTVKKLTPKMVSVWESGMHGKWYSGSKKYPHDIVKVEGPEVTMYLLKLTK